MSLSQTEKECLNFGLENVNGWSSPTAQGHITWRLELASSGGYARQTVEQLRRENPEFTAPDLWPPNSPDRHRLELISGSKGQRSRSRSSKMS